MVDADDIFADQVHAVVRQLGEWVREKRPNTDQLMPALAVVLGRLIAHRAQTDHELENLLGMAMTAATSSACEEWSEKKRNTKGTVQ